MGLILSGKSGNFFFPIELSSRHVSGVQEWMTSFRYGLPLIKLGPCTLRRTPMLMRLTRDVVR